MLAATAAAFALALSAAAPAAAAPPTAAAAGSAGVAGQAPPSAADARAFVARVDGELRRLWVRQATADWVRATDISDDSDRLSAWAREEVTAYVSAAIRESLRYASVPGLDGDTARKLSLLRRAELLPAPDEPAARAELAALAARLESAYGKARYCGADGRGPCRDLEQLSEVMETSRDWDALLDAWRGWHGVAQPLKDDYARSVALSNEGARSAGFRDLGELWRAGYDMPPDDFVTETDRLWAQVEPLYDDLHCYVRARLQERYGRERVPDGQPIPAHLLGNMWAQEWGNVFPLVAPPGAAGELDLSAALRARGYDATRLVKLGESFFTSLGLDPLPATFWARSMLVKPRDREVVCHASAWDVGWNDDLRLKMCIRLTADDVYTVHHELGHDYYFHAYHRLPVLFQQGANDGFHEAIGDAIALSVTPGYLARAGVLERVPPDDERGLVAVQLRQALDKIAFLPFARVVDGWRWGVFAGKIPPSRYNQAWWELRRRYQGVAPPVPRSEADFDPGAKYHVAAHVPYARYFLAAIYQFQFHRALCRAAGHTGPLHACSIHGSAEAGRRLQAMMALGASKPWPDAMQALTGGRAADASAILDYFAPLQRWLREQNRGRACGW